MSRFKRFAHSLLSGYVQLGANMVYTLVSVPLALHFLPKAEFGLWALTSQIAGYIGLMDFGFSASASRILVDYKDEPRGGEYGCTIQTGALVGLTQAALILIAGTALAFVIGPLLDVPQKLAPEFFWLVIGQSGVTALLFGTRIVAHVLTAHQRFDVVNYSSACAIAANGLTLYWGFAHGVGVYSLLWGQGAGAVVNFVINGLGCGKLRLLPEQGHWGRPTWDRFCELFSYGRDFFLFMVGNQFINASQTLLLTRLIGLDAAAVWTVCTRTYIVLMQVIGRIFDYSSSALAEMIVRGERELLLRRFRDIAALSANLSVAAAVLFALCNGPFVEVWTSGKIQWAPVNNVLLALWMIIGICVRLHMGLVGQTKAFHFLRYIYFIEGLVFIGLTVLFHRFGGITVMLVSSIVCSLCFTFPYSWYRTSKYFGLSLRAVALWHQDTVILTAVTAPVAAALWWLTRHQPPLRRLILETMIAGPWVAVMFLRYGLVPTVQPAVFRYAPRWIRPLFRRA